MLCTFFTAKAHLCVCFCRHNYLCVIYSWDEQCRVSQDWLYQMGENCMTSRINQPFYGVLVSDGSVRYAAQGLYVCVAYVAVRLLRCYRKP